MSDDQKEKSPDRKQIEELALRAANKVTGEPVVKHTIEVMQGLMEDIKQDVLQASMESLLLYRGHVAQQRDTEWARIMAAIWVQNTDLELPTNPFEMQALILGWQKSRESKQAILKYNEGLERGWHAAYTEGSKFGYGASQMGKDLSDVVRVAENKKPSL